MVSFCVGLELFGFLRNERTLAQSGTSKIFLELRNRDIITTTATTFLAAPSSRIRPLQICYFYFALQHHTSSTYNHSPS